MKKLLTAVASLLFVAMPAFATPTEVPVGKITFIAAGWNDPSLRIILDKPQYNPENCSSTNGYMIPPNTAGNQLFTSMAISAHSTKKNVILVIDGCYGSYPKVIGIYLQD